MKISTKSWHYRLLDFYDFDIPQNLCPYFWKVVGTVIFTPLILLGFAIGALLDAYESRHEPKYKDFKPYSKNRIIASRIAILAGFFVYGMLATIYLHTLWYVAFAGFFVMVATYGLIFILSKKHFRIERRPKPKKPKEPNIAWEYLKAKKHKYCPVITFYNPEMEDESWKKGWQ